jgi:hypothetical protein
LIVIGVDPGKDTGLAAWHALDQSFLFVESMLIHRALARVLELTPSLVIVEDAHQRYNFGDSGRERLQGAGSVKRDSTIWSDFLIDHSIPHLMRRPTRAGTKWTALAFKHATGWQKQTNEHARDAGLIVYKLTPQAIRTLILR